MKFLGMHDKFSQTNTEYLLEFAPKWPSSRNQLCHAKSQHMEEKKSVSQSEIFHGFQTIRKAEKDLIFTDLETPNFAIRLENIIKNETRTEDKLKLVNEKLEKLTSDDNTKNEAIANPLQHFVFGSNAGLPRTTIVKECRTSLLELFQKTEMADEKTDAKSNIRNKTENKTVNLVKMMLKKRSTAASVVTINSASADVKLPKILRMLHRVHPEASADSQKSQNLWKYVANSNFIDKEIITFPYKAAISETRENHTKSKAYNPVNGDTNWKREYWIKSDAEYLILEL